ncbi:MAG: hypothetical protein WCH99_11780 [Verrucomicrobiota bacterium]
MKKTWLKLFALISFAVMMAGCVVMSVYPYYTVKDLTFDPGLSGRWAKAGATNEFWEFTPVTNKYYLVTILDGQETNRFDGYLFHLKGLPFLDLCTTNRDGLNQLPLHLAVKVARNQDELQLAMLNYEWLGKLLAANPATLRHIIVPDKPLETNNGEKYYLTADTRDLQKFLLKHQNNTNAFTPLDQMQRLVK